MGIEPSSMDWGSISKQIVARRTPLAKPRASDIKSEVGVIQRARRPPIGEATAAAPATPTTKRKLGDMRS